MARIFAASRVKGYANDLKASPDGQLIAAAMETGDVRLWNSADGSERSTIAAGKEPLLGVAFSVDGKLVAAAGGDDTRLSRTGVAKVWNVADGSEAKALDVQPEKCAINVAFAPDGTALYVGDMNDRVTVFDLSTGVARGYFGKHGRPVNSVVPMKRWIARRQRRRRPFPGWKPRQGLDTRRRQGTGDARTSQGARSRGSRCRRMKLCC